jgi:hypothetical protein
MTIAQGVSLGISKREKPSPGGAAEIMSPLPGLDYFGVNLNQG